jgi:hypothetical protein
MSDPTQPSDPAVTAVLKGLRQTLGAASALSCEAYEAIIQNRQNQAIGTILELDDLLKAAGGLLQAAITLHRLSQRSGFR